ncbi:YcgN family cysteine cluster protein [Aliiroseovarius sp. F47248L]|uniref:YcgN family cysteine cluster protein n=1 Tax=Aliiroseovarius sp. F47248L TaxID=2926420 RepID=UPI001FF6F5A2|nr:YcgN family cysteine cluster protein [Aliiroseovarius sp. F47248L]MCK0139551.1 YcgN family cysteine cluster protein [Aliiroseovarius sp. F47248L]
MTKSLRNKFWERPLDSLTGPEWEALCDGCGKCCLNKLEDEDTGDVVFTRVACRLLDGDTCRCSQYDIRLNFVPECIVLTPENIGETAYFMPASCAYRLRHEGKSLDDWHPLISGDPDSVHKAGRSVQGWTVPEFEVPEDEWEDHLIEEPH